MHALVQPEPIRCIMHRVIFHFGFMRTTAHYCLSCSHLIRLYPSTGYEEDFFYATKFYPDSLRETDGTCDRCKNMHRPVFYYQLPTS